jgi:hypothetical protein
LAERTGSFASEALARVPAIQLRAFGTPEAVRLASHSIIVETVGMLV